MAIGRERFLDLRENYQATPEDLGIMLAALNKLSSNSLLKPRNAVVVMLDSEECQLIEPVAILP